MKKKLFPSIILGVVIILTFSFSKRELPKSSGPGCEGCMMGCMGAYYWCVNNGGTDCEATRNLCVYECDC